MNQETYDRFRQADERFEAEESEWQLKHPNASFIRRSAHRALMFCVRFAIAFSIVTTTPPPERR